jgi:CubicO group peptidase (beta-lactamase class C family)
MKEFEWLAGLVRKGTEQGVVFNLTAEEWKLLDVDPAPVQRIDFQRFTGADFRDRSAPIATKKIERWKISKTRSGKGMLLGTEKAFLKTELTDKSRFFVVGSVILELAAMVEIVNFPPTRFNVFKLIFLDGLTIVGSATRTPRWTVYDDEQLTIGTEPITTVNEKGDEITGINMFDYFQSTPKTRTVRLPQMRGAVVDYLVQIDYFHRKTHLAHRDIKGENVMIVSGKGPGWKTKIIDYGFAGPFDRRGLDEDRQEQVVSDDEQLYHQEALHAIYPYWHPYIVSGKGKAVLEVEAMEGGWKPVTLTSSGTLDRVVTRKDLQKNDVFAMGVAVIHMLLGRYGNTNFTVGKKKYSIDNDWLWPYVDGKYGYMLFATRGPPSRGTQVIDPAVLLHAESVIDVNYSRDEANSFKAMLRAMLDSKAFLDEESDLNTAAGALKAGGYIVNPDLDSVRPFLEVPDFEPHTMIKFDGGGGSTGDGMDTNPTHTSGPQAPHVAPIAAAKTRAELDAAFSWAMGETASTGGLIGYPGKPYLASYGDVHRSGRVWSVTKSICGFVIAKATMEGRYDPTQPVQTQLRKSMAFYTHMAGITPAHLLTHTSGLKTEDIGVMSYMKIAIKKNDALGWLPDKEFVEHWVDDMVKGGASVSYYDSPKRTADDHAAVAAASAFRGNAPFDYDDVGTQIAVIAFAVDQRSRKNDDSYTVLQEAKDLQFGGRDIKWQTPFEGAPHRFTVGFAGVELTATEMYQLGRTWVDKYPDVMEFIYNSPLCATITDKRTRIGWRYSYFFWIPVKEAVGGRRILCAIGFLGQDILIDLDTKLVAVRLHRFNEGGDDIRHDVKNKFPDFVPFVTAYLDRLKALSSV